MNQQLSRAETYGHRRRKEDKDTKPKSHKNMVDESKAKIHSVQSTSTNSKSQNKQQPVPELSRMQRKLQSESKPKQQGNDRIQEAETLPTRADLFPSRRLRLSKWFINSLIFLFILLTGFLVYWGIIGAPSLDTMIP
ncbi:hypothetical protein [Paenibacillus sp. Marseille-Q4541]|uniref:hypothetical protein n=1 Tax=Paenibacillus sp. Marseille-Q4541 TaxID=2831522 RepID=UPI001BAA55EF|nr:hypothetical protein [Paenibacillus sp. Marseille-Q4541]